MLNVLKWIWDKAEERATERVVTRINSLSDYHRMQAEVTYYKDTYEPPKGELDDSKKGFLTARFTATEHESIARALEDVADNFQRVHPHV